MACFTSTVTYLNIDQKSLTLVIDVDTNKHETRMKVSCVKISFAKTMFDLKSLSGKNQRKIKGRQIGVEISCVNIRFAQKGYLQKLLKDFASI